MPCIRTGAHIFIEPYSEWAYGDAYEIEPLLNQAQWSKLHTALGRPPFGGIYYFRIVQRSFTPLASAKHFTVHNYSDWFDKDGRASCLITNDCTNHGYAGVEI